MIKVNVTHPAVYVGGEKPLPMGEQSLDDALAKKLIKRKIAIAVVDEEKLEVATPKATASKK